MEEFTNRSLPKFHRTPWEYNHSLDYFKALCLVTVLQRDCGLRYNKAKVSENAPFTPAESFVHGALLGAGGTCATIPVIYASIGRRLNYPIKLVEAAGRNGLHLFARWEGGGARFNIEATSLGLYCPPDDYYRLGSYEISPEQEKLGCLLRSKTPREELSSCLAQRAVCWLDVGCRRKAVVAFAWAWALQPDNVPLYNRLVNTCNEWGTWLKRIEPPGFPKMLFWWPSGRWPPSFPAELEREIYCLEAWESLLLDPMCEQKWWGPMRREERLAVRPVNALIHNSKTGRQIRFEFETTRTN